MAKIQIGLAEVSYLCNKCGAIESRSTYSYPYHKLTDMHKMIDTKTPCIACKGHKHISILRIKCRLVQTIKRRQGSGGIW